MMPDLLQATDLHKTYHMGSAALHVLQGVDLTVKAGEWVAVLGASGSGKSTLLHLIGALDTPDSGQVLFQERSIFAHSRRQQDVYRNKHVGFVFQQYHLLPELNVLENVTLAAMIGIGPIGWLSKRAAARETATKIIDSLGLLPRLKHRPSQLSGGERQRVAIARALVNQPDLLLADEPTGNLDTETGKQIMGVFRQIHDRGQAIVMVTHDERVAREADRQVRLESGRLK